MLAFLLSKQIITPDSSLYRYLLLIAVLIAVSFCRLGLLEEESTPPFFSTRSPLPRCLSGDLKDRTASVPFSLAAPFFSDFSLCSI